MLTSIIIPQYQRWDLTHARLYELYKSVPSKDTEIVIIDDCSPDESYMGGLAWWQKKVEFHTVRYKRNKENVGFGQTCNAGAKIAHGDVLVFLSNDVIVRGNFLAEIHSKIAEDVLIGGQVVDWAGGWNEFQVNGRKMIVPYAAGWLLACTRSVWDQLGGFDPLYGRFDYEDVDLSTKAISLGLRIVPLNSPYLEHISGATIATLGIDRQRITIENRTKYENKWKEEFPKIFERLENSYGERE